MSGTYSEDDIEKMPFSRKKLARNFYGEAKVGHFGSRGGEGVGPEKQRGGVTGNGVAGWDLVDATNEMPCGQQTCKMLDAVVVCGISC